MRHLDLFSGIGGFALAASRIWDNHEVVSFCDNEPFAQKVLKKHWPDVPCHDDIKDLTVDTHGNLLYIDAKGGVLMAQNRLKKYDNSVDLYSSGLSIQDCADFYGITRQAMHKILQRRGCEFRSQRKSGEDNHFHRGGAITGSKRAGHLVEKAIKKGILVARSECEECGSTSTFQDGRSGIQAHHDDYNRPLDVRWLCQSCHHDWHKSNKAKEVNQELAPRIDLLTGGFP